MITITVIVELRVVDGESVRVVLLLPVVLVTFLQLSPVLTRLENRNLSSAVFLSFFYLDVGHDGLVPLVPLALVAALGQLGGHDHLLVLALLALPVRQRLDPLHLGHHHLLLLHLLLHQHRPEVHPPLHGDEELELGGAGACRGGDRAGEVSLVVRLALLQSHRDRVVLSVCVQLAPGQS